MDTYHIYIYDEYGGCDIRLSSWVRDSCVSLPELIESYVADVSDQAFTDTLWNYKLLAF